MGTVTSLVMTRRAVLSGATAATLVGCSTARDTGTHWRRTTPGNHNATDTAIVVPHVSGFNVRAAALIGNRYPSRLVQTQSGLWAFGSNDQQSGANQQPNGLITAGLPDNELSTGTTTFEVQPDNEVHRFVNDGAQIPGGFILAANGGFYHVIQDGDLFTVKPLSAYERGFFGSGTLVSGSQIFMTTSSVQGLYAGDGQVIAKHVESNVIRTDRVISVSGKNPTGMAERIYDGKRELIVLSSGNGSDKRPYITRIDATNFETIAEIKIDDDMKAQLNGQLALSEDGTFAYLGTMDSSGRIVRMNLNTKDVEVRDTGVNGEHSSLVLSGGILYLSDNIYGVVQPMVWNSGTGTSIEFAETIVFDTEPNDSGNLEAGPSVAYNSAGILQSTGGLVFVVEPT